MCDKNYPEATVGSLVVRSDGKILLVKSHKWNNYFSVPGGHIEFGEKAEDAIKREVLEETGLDVEVIGLLMVQQAINPEGYYKKNVHYIFLDYLCKAKTADVKLDNKELQDYLWIDPKDALKLNLEPYTRKLLEKYIKEYLTSP
ncbi:MAG: NUDIX domain-containing protein [Thermoprotei archaeon]